MRRPMSSSFIHRRRGNTCAGGDNGACTRPSTGPSKHRIDYRWNGPRDKLRKDRMDAAIHLRRENIGEC